MSRLDVVIRYTRRTHCVIEISDRNASVTKGRATLTTVRALVARKIPDPVTAKINQRSTAEVSFSVIPFSVLSYLRYMKMRL